MLEKNEFLVKCLSGYDKECTNQLAEEFQGYNHNHFELVWAFAFTINLLYVHANFCFKIK